MVVSVEWRINQGTDTIIVVDAIALKVAEVSAIDAAVLKDYLAVTGDLAAWKKWDGWKPVDGDDDPDAWGDLIIGRNDDGEVFYVNPDLYWEGIRRWFRSRGVAE